MKRLLLSVLACLLLTGNAFAWMGALGVGASGGSSISGWIGNTDCTTGDSTSTEGDDIVCGAKINITCTGTVNISKISGMFSTSASTVDMKLGLYTDSSGTPNTKVADRTLFSDIGTLDDGWHDYDVSYTINCSTDYWICWSNNGGSSLTFHYTLPGGTQRHSDATNFTVAWPATFTSYDNSGSKRCLRAWYYQ